MLYGPPDLPSLSFIAIARTDDEDEKNVEEDLSLFNYLLALCIYLSLYIYYDRR